ncbi:MAG TPA: hypothetical protein VKH44_01035 [Pirellulaceae bacterium]|nr:hypothetical protein [Pirellulaceae bacterium]
MLRTHILACPSIIVVALLVAAWIANFFGQFGLGTRFGKFDQHFTFRSGSLCIAQHGNFMKQGIFWLRYSRLPPEIAEGVGDLSSLSARLKVCCLDWDDCGIEVPIIPLITAMTPRAYGSFSKCRFRLWQFFAFTAVVAVEFTFFLRK